MGAIRVLQPFYFMLIDEQVAKGTITKSFFYLVRAEKKNQNGQSSRNHSICKAEWEKNGTSRYCIYLAANLLAFIFFSPAHIAFVNWGNRREIEEKTSSHRYVFYNLKKVNLLITYMQIVYIKKTNHNFFEYSLLLIRMPANLLLHE